ncbi:hypothetical protein BZA05DRAFT_418243 [Tricharina praecox]|uniref:uncharacterized protein n=1 Tax=Tricharina praecox TaxID=43433 RepID=UPI00221E94BC|nr:uncharacterized protein BZA05DRAFT_418243 [Tricharina praecox]KAI5853449.1 hypothetical protein BZA05DRAFT_418243 [Tricharina praecox]
MPDARWSLWLALPTLLFQFIALICVIGLSSSFMNNGFVVSIGPLSIAALGVISALTHLICYVTSSLHPLVVLTISCEWMVLWIATTAFEIVIYTQDPSTGCGSSEDFDYNYYYGYHDGSDDEKNAENKQMLDDYRKKVCQKSGGILALMALITVSYIWLVAYSAIVRKHTRMPFVPSDQRPLMGQVRQQQQEDPERAMGTTASPIAGATARRAPLVGVPEEEEARRSPVERPSGDAITPVAPAASAHAGTAV